ncbi:MAG: RNA-binding S4 domain-containing protein [Bacteroidales bacterium]|jgi:ribosome-associated heat shock protein Hsp15|nr:RNA-binding S4 domain-containing protein [Bacteroidales bacterium]
MNPEHEISGIRIDKFLWSVRLYKTRSIASDECRKGRIVINNVQVKPSRIVEGNEIITIRKPPVTYTYRVIKPIENRVSAKLVSNFIEDLTPEQEKIKLEIRHSPFPGFRLKGLGRPTKKERRNLDRFIDDRDSG